MPTSPFGILDLINIVRTPGTLNNATETGGDISVALAGSNQVDVSAAGACVFTFTVGFITGNDIQTRADVDWLSGILSLPVGARITRVRITARAEHSGRTSSTYARDSGTFLKTNTDNVQASASLPLPNYAPGFVSQNVLNALDSAAELIATTSWNLISSIGPGSTLLNKEWNFASLPGGSISDTDFYANFTAIGINADGKARLVFSGSSSGSGTCSSDQEGAIDLTVTSWSMSVTWTWIHQWTMNPPDMSGVQQGDLVTITSTGPDALLLDELTLEMGGSPIVPITQTANELTFNVPALSAGLQPVIATGNGVQFSGSVGLGVLEVIGADVSGIYVLEPGKLNDTLYSSARDGSVTERAIPNPFIETGFIGG